MLERKPIADLILLYIGMIHCNILPLTVMSYYVVRYNSLYFLERMYLMNINNVFRDNFNSTSYYIKGNTVNDPYATKRKSNKNSDTIEISDDAYKVQQEEKISATSGKDVLGITKNTKENKYIIHFTDSAMVNRAVSRGYITINGVNIELSNDAKKKLLETDKEAEKNRMDAYNNYVMQHELAVAQQQSETWKKAMEDTAEAFMIAAKLSSGAQITSNEAQKLIKIDPQLYAMSVCTSALSNQSNKTVSNSATQKHTVGNTQNGVEWSQFEWKTYECQMDVSFDGGYKIGSISKGEITLNKGS